MTDWGGLLEFCETDRQRLVIGLRQKGLSAREVGEQVGAHEIGGLHHESWNVLPPPDAWHAASGYGSSRSMTAVLLHKTFGEHSRFKVGAEEL